MAPSTLPVAPSPPRPPAIPVRRGWLPGGDAGIFATLAAMRAIARDAATHPLIRQLAQDVRSAAPRQTARALKAWLVARSTFVPDPPQLELIVTPLEHLRRFRHLSQIAGDCDDVATFGAAMARAAGLPARFVVVGFGAPGPAAAYRHVYTEVGVPTFAGLQWLDLDTQRTPTSPVATRRAVVRV